MACHPALRGVALLGHALEEEGEGCVEYGGHGLEDFSWYSVWAGCLVVGHAFEAFEVPVIISFDTPGTNVTQV